MQEARFLLSPVVRLEAWAIKKPLHTDYSIHHFLGRLMGQGHFVEAVYIEIQVASLSELI